MQYWLTGGSLRKDRSAFENGTEIAVVGLAGRFPGASSTERLWHLLQDGQDGLSRFSLEELIESGVRADVAGAADYVPVSGIIEGFDLFDAEFFGIAPAEAALMDPQPVSYTHLRAHETGRNLVCR